jgi:hypothetical protein
MSRSASFSSVNIRVGELFECLFVAKLVCGDSLGSLEVWQLLDYQWNVYFLYPCYCEKKSFKERGTIISGSYSIFLLETNFKGFKIH